MEFLGRVQYAVGSDAKCCLKRGMAKVHGIRITVTSGRQIAHDMYEWQCHGWHLKISIFQENLTSVITYYLIIIGQVYGAVIMNKSLQEFLSSSNECRTLPSGCRPLDQANRLGLFGCQQAAITYTHQGHTTYLFR